MNNARILIVDDNHANQHLISYILEYDGFEVLTADDAESALEIIDKTPPVLILMDIALPGMDGLTLTRQLKANPTTSHIKIVALTAYAMKGDDEKAREAGCDGYITKPIDTRGISEEVRGFLGGMAQTDTE